MFNLVERGMRLPLTPSFISNHMNFGLLKDRFIEQLARWDTERCFCKNKFRFIVVKNQRSRRPMKPHETYSEKLKNNVYAPWKVIYLVHGIPTPLKNYEFVRLDHHPNYWGKSSIHVPNHQAVTCLFHMIFHMIFHHMSPPYSTVINRSFSPWNFQPWRLSHSRRAQRDHPGV